MPHKPASPDPESTSELRRHIREKRCRLTEEEQGIHATQLASLVTQHQQFLNSNRVASYLSNDGEINPVNIISQAWTLGKQVYLPVLQPLDNSLKFALYEPESVLHSNKYGIQEPGVPPSELLSAEQLDLVLVPLVAFDLKNNRLGMGGGFYDRSLAHRNTRSNSKPYLIGLAHELQKTEHLPTQDWDVRMDAIATEREIYSSL